MIAVAEGKAVKVQFLRKCPHEGCPASFQVHVGIVFQETSMVVRDWDHPEANLPGIDPGLCSRCKRPVEWQEKEVTITDPPIGDAFNRWHRELGLMLFGELPE